MCSACNVKKQIDSNLWLFQVQEAITQIFSKIWFAHMQKNF